MSNHLKSFQGLFALKTFAPIQVVPSNFQDAAATQQLCDYIEQQKGAALELHFKQGKISEFVDGRLYFTEEYQYRVYALPIHPERDLEGTIYWGKTEVTFSMSILGKTIVLFIHAFPPEGESTSEDFLVFKCTFERYVPEQKEPKAEVGQYPIDQRLVGHWRHSDRYGSGGFSSYTETNMYLAPNGTFWRQRRSFSNSTFTDQFGNWSGMGSTDSGNGPKQTGQWGVIDNKFFLIIDGSVLYNMPFEVYPDSLFFQFANGKKELWKKG